MSILSISSAMVMDSGNYTCSLPSSDLLDEVEVSLQPGDHIQQLRPSSSSYTVIADPYSIVIVMVCSLYSLLLFSSVYTTVAGLRER